MDHRLWVSQHGPQALGQSAWTTGSGSVTVKLTTDKSFLMAQTGYKSSKATNPNPPCKKQPGGIMNKEERASLALAIEIRTGRNGMGVTVKKKKTKKS